MRTRLPALVPAFCLLVMLGCDGHEAGPDDVIGPSAVTGLAATLTGTRVAVTWQDPAEPDFAYTLLVRYPGSVADGVPVDHVIYVVGDLIGSGVVVSRHADEAEMDSPPGGCGTWTYQAWAVDDVGNWAATGPTVTVTLGGAGPTPTQPPSGLSSSVTTSAVQLLWSNPSPATGFAWARVVRTVGAAPAGPMDGTLVEVGTDGSAADPLPGLMPGTTYWYGVYACGPCGACEPAGVATSVTPTVVQCLRAGGYHVAWRHASATVCGDRTDLGPAATTSVPNWWRSCDANCATATARQLNSTGVMESIAIGNDMRARGIPIGRVLSSEFCRNFTTADLMAFGPAVEQLQEITFYVYDEANRCNNWMQLIADPTAPGTNTASIGHAGFTCPTLDTLQWGEAAIYKPDGSGGSTLIRRVRWNEWATLP
jgi:phosphohistidine phosphatase SixA